MQLRVNSSQRYGKQRSHTATHLLHAELCSVLPETKQQWSLVEDDYLRFDFNSDKFLTNNEIEKIENNINNIIKSGHHVTTKEMDINDAEKLWAKMFFQDKYGSRVRVVNISSDNANSKAISIELCWGIHVTNTKEIGIFKIISQESIASGIKRIVAYTWPKVSEYIKDKDNLIDSINIALWTTSNQIIDKITRLELQNKSLSSKLDTVYQNWFGINIKNKINISEIEIFEDIVPKDLLWFVKNTKKDIIIYDNDWSFLIYSPTGRARQIWQWLKWWWNDQLFQWKDLMVSNINI